MRARSAWGAAIAAVVSVGLSACAPPFSYDLESRARPEWTVQARLVGTPAAADGVVVSYIDGGEDQLAVVAWDRGSGKELWHDAAALGSIPRYADPSIQLATVDGRKVATYLQDDPGDENGWQRVVVAELATGAHLDDGSLSVDAVTLPGECDDDADGVCLHARSSERYAAGVQRLQVDLEAGTLESMPGASLPSNARFLGSNVYSTLDREPEGTELLGYASNGITLWERPYTEVFGPGYSSDGGWWWLDDDERLAFVGNGSPYDPDDSADLTATYPLTDDMVVGLDPETGDTLWKIEAANRFCDAGEISDTLVQKVVPMCIFASGSVTVDRHDANHPTLDAHHVDATLVGVEIATGRRAWSIPLGGDASVFGSFESRFRSTVAVRPVMVEGELRLVDALTGRSSAVPRAARLACESERTPISAHQPGNPTADPGLYGAGYGAFACDVEQTPSGDQALSPGALAMAAIDAGDGWQILGGTGSLSAYRDPNAQ